MVVDDLGARHASTLNGALLPPDKKPAVTVVLDASAAKSHAWQAATWLLTDLVSRGAGHAATLTVVTGEAKAVLALPGVDLNAPLGHALVERSTAIGGVPTVLADRPSAGSIAVRVGPGRSHADLELVADDWAGGVRTPCDARHLGVDEPTLLIGALVGACHAAAALFREARFAEPGPAGVWHDAWELRVTSTTEATPSSGPSEAPLDLDALALAGMGAVGNAFALAALTHPGASGTLQAADFDVVDLTNLNRCVLFVREDLDKLKADVATRAVAAIGGPGVRLHAAPQRAEVAFREAPVTMLVSAVDTNRAREAINRLVARTVLAGSTWQLRAQTTVLTQPGPCLRCFNPPEPVEPDREVKARILAANPNALEAMAVQAGVTASRLWLWATTAGCGELDASVLPLLRQGDLPTFSVGFVSVLSGVLLAAAAIRCALDQPTAPRTARAQLFHPSARAQEVQRTPRDPCCPACGPGGALPAIWRTVW